MFFFCWFYLEFDVFNVKGVSCLQRKTSSILWCKTNLTKMCYGTMCIIKSSIFINFCLVEEQDFKNVIL